MDDRKLQHRNRRSRQYQAQQAEVHRAIDGVVALTMAMGRVTVQAGEYCSVYETEDVKWV